MELTCCPQRKPFRTLCPGVAAVISMGRDHWRGTQGARWNSICMSSRAPQPVAPDHSCSCTAHQASYNSVAIDKYRDGGRNLLGLTCPVSLCPSANVYSMP